MYNTLKSLPKIKNESVVNDSFNKCMINSPGRCGFASSAVAIDFFNAGMKFHELDFFTFHIQWFAKRNQTMENFIEERLRQWRRDQSIDDEIKKRYIFDVFITRTFNGINSERKFFNFISSLVDKVRHATVEEDIDSHFDFKIAKNGSIFYIQLKPASFIYGSDKPYIQRSIKTMQSVNLPLFIVIYEKSSFFIVIRDPVGKVKKLYLKEFLDANLSDKQLMQLSIETFDKLSS